jgi:hypothetical protein
VLTAPQPEQRTVRLHPAQQAFLQSDALYRAFCGGIGSGKSWAGSYDLIRRAKPGRLYLVVAPTYAMLSDATFRIFLALAEQLGLVAPGYVKRSAPPSIRLRTGAEVLFRSADEPDRLRGPNLSGMWMDEASLMSHEAFDIAIGRLREGGEQGWLAATFTPKGMEHWTYATFATGQPNTALFRCRTADNPFLPPDFSETVRRQYTHEFAEQELEGEFIDTDEGAKVIPPAWIRLAQQRWERMDKGCQGPPGVQLSAVGVDVARGGKDKTILAKRYRNWFAPLIKRPGAATPDGYAVAELIQQAIADNTQALVCIDAIGIGASPVDACRRIMPGVRLFPINSSAGVAATDQTGILTFANVRAFAYWKLRELLDPANKHDVALPPDADLLTDLSAPKWQMTTSGIRVEPKTDVIKRIGRSPDCGDAVTYSILLPPF